MLRIAFTPVAVRQDECEYIRTIIDSGWDFIHLRHPGLDCNGYRRILDRLDEEYRCKIRLHDHFSITGEYGVAGIHLNSRSPVSPHGYKGEITRSLHREKELDVKEADDVYVTFSPVYPSISKEGYSPTLDIRLIKDKIKAYPSPVIALGGITPGNCGCVEEMGFSGYAILGYLAEASDVTELRHLLKQFKNV